MKNVYVQNVKARILKGLYPRLPLREINLYLRRNQNVPQVVPQDAAVLRRSIER